MTDQSSSFAAITPPESDQELVRWLQLIRSYRVGPSTFYRLLAEHGSAGQALRALPGVAKAAGVADYAVYDPVRAEREFRAGRRLGLTLLTAGAASYPALLSEIADPPPLIWTMGNPALLSRPMIALIGARNASSLGTRTARKLASDLADAGFVIVSGLARGIDAAAHAAALDLGTAAVMAGGVDVIYPTENTALAERIAAQGLRLSEQPIGARPQARHFPRRNRIISGLAQAVVVVEAAAKSGSLITARNALDQGREVFAVPGHPFDSRAAGCNHLIRDGAPLVRSAEDVIEVLRLRAPPVAEPPGRPGPAAADILGLDQRILELLGPSPIAEDQLIRDLGVPAAAVASTLLDMEIDGAVQRQAGGLLSLPGGGATKSH
ncbi:MAG: DNA-processing protein DprA [Pseudomonadota bacterium]